MERESETWLQLRKELIVYSNNYRNIKKATKNSDIIQEQLKVVVM